MPWIRGGILGKVDKLIFEELGLAESKNPPHYQRPEACQEISSRTMLHVNGKTLVEKIYRQITDNWHGFESRGDENWRWEPKTTIPKTRSKEVILERLIVRTMGREWVNQVPTSSGLTKVIKPRQSFDKRRAVDLVHRCGNGQYEMIELKVDPKAGPPLFAAMEILQYGLLYTFYRVHLKNLELKQLEAEKNKLLVAEVIRLKVLAPESYYKNKKGEDYRLGPLKGMINDGLKSFLTGKKFGFKMDFEFQKFHLDFALDSVVMDRKSPDQRIVEALNRRKSVPSKHA